jgi:tetratricopeptide (TPR) repeat protein
MRKSRFTALMGLTGMALGAWAGMESPAQAANAPQRTNSPTGTYLSANFAASEGDITGAADFYAEMLKQDPANADVLVRSFAYSATAGDFERAIPLAQRVVAVDPENRRAHLVLGVAAIGKKNFEQARGNIALAGRGPFNALTNALLDAWALAGQNKTDESVQSLAQIANQMGAEGLYAFHKALLLDFGGRVDEADAAYKEAISVVGAAPRASDAYGRFLRRHNRIDEAKALYARMAAANAGNPVAAAAQAEMAAGSRMPPALVSNAPEGAAEGLFAIAASLTGENASDTAVLYLNLAVYLRPDFDLARALLGDRYERVGRFDMAVAIYSKVPASSPYYPIVQVQSAIDTGRMGKTDEAISKMRAVTQLRPQDGDAWTGLGDLLRNTDRYAEAIPAYDKALTLLPENDGRRVGLYYARGICFQSTNRFDEAERDFKQALTLNPNRADVLNYLGYSWVDRGKNLDDAVKMLEKARSLRPNDGYIADSVGWAYFKLGRYKEAAEILEEAVQLAPGASEVNDHLGDAYWRVGRKLDARFEWRHALALDPDAAVRPIIEQKLQLGLDAVKPSGS